MKDNFLNRGMNRRRFIRQSACAGLGAISMINTLSSLRLMAAATALNSSISNCNDYKALVCVYMHGGNDSHNLLFPVQTSNHSAFTNYSAKRGALVPDSMNPLSSSNLSGAAFERFYPDEGPSNLGIHPSASEIGSLFQQEKLAFVCNVGTLAFPIENRQSANVNLLPPDLLSHNSQAMQWATSLSGAQSATGWGGRVADMILESGACDLSDNVSMSISLGGATSFMRSLNAATSPLAISKNGAVGLRDPKNWRKDIMNNLIDLSNQHLMVDEYSARSTRAFASNEIISTAINSLGQVTNPNSINAQIDDQFVDVNGSSLAQQLRMVAKLIASRSVLENNRQIFFVNVGGFDTHDNHLEAHAGLMEELSKSLDAFRRALEVVNDFDKVVTFTTSEFNRTLVPNNDGLDHAWAGHHIVMGGPVNGGEIYGHLPSYLTSVDDPVNSMDVSGTNISRGHFIPTVSVDQYSAKLAQWFGIDSGLVTRVFDHLDRFGTETDYYAGANLDFI